MGTKIATAQLAEKNSVQEDEPDRKMPSELAQSEIEMVSAGHIQSGYPER
jgi:hypothetical protein